MLKNPAMPLLLCLAVSTLFFAGRGVCGESNAIAGEASSPYESAGNISTKDGWIPLPPKNAKVAAGYVTIGNKGSSPDRLIAVSSDWASRVEMHTMNLHGPMMTMRPVLYGVALPIGEEVSFGPGGIHIMFLNFSRTVAVGDQIQIRLFFERAGAIDTLLEVRSPSVAH